MLFMVIETFGHNPKAVYRRFREKGRQMPDGLEFVDSWVTADFSRCFQRMRCDDATLLQRWVAEWCDLGGFEIVPVVSGRETAAALGEHLWSQDLAGLGVNRISMIPIICPQIPNVLSFQWYPASIRNYLESHVPSLENIGI